MLLFGLSLNLGSYSNVLTLKKLTALFKLTVSRRSVLCQKWCRCYWQNLLTMFGSVCRSADLSEYYRRDIVFYHIGAVIVHLSRGSSSYLCSAHSLAARLIRGLACYTSTTNRWDALIRFLWNTEAVLSHFIHHDKSLNDSKRSHRVFGVLTCLIVMLYLFEFHWRIVERFMSMLNMLCY